MSNPVTSLPPGFRFHPTDEELIQHYLKNRAASAPCPVSIIAEVDIYKFDPWDLPAKAMFGDREWYFFSPRDRKYPNGVRPNRAAGSGYWKATGTDKPIQASTGKENIGVKKALVFYKGKPPKGTKTNWIMHEYRIAEVGNTNTYKPMKLRDHSMRLDDWVLCRIYKKSNNLGSVPPPLMDQEQEESVSGAEDTYMPTMQNITEGKIPKSFSVSEFLDYSNMSHLFDTQPELPGFDYNSLMQQQSSSSSELLIDGGSYGTNGNNYLIPNRFETQQHHLVDENPGLKRQRTNDSCFVPNFSNQFDSPQYNLFNQQLLLNSHLGLH